MCVCARLRVHVCGWVSPSLFSGFSGLLYSGAHWSKRFDISLSFRYLFQSVQTNKHTRYINNIIAKIAVKEYWNLHASLQLLEESENMIISIYRWHSTRVKSFLTVWVYVLSLFFAFYSTIKSSVFSFLFFLLYLFLSLAWCTLIFELIQLNSFSSSHQEVHKLNVRYILLNRFHSFSRLSRCLKISVHAWESK